MTLEIEKKHLNGSCIIYALEENLDTDYNFIVDNSAVLEQSK